MARQSERNPGPGRSIGGTRGPPEEPSGRGPWPPTTAPICRRQAHRSLAHGWILLKSSVLAHIRHSTAQRMRLS